jgi:hypothetical protein
VAEVTFRVEMASDRVSDVCIGLVEEHPFLSTSIVYGDSLVCHCGQEDSRPFGSNES